MTRLIAPALLAVSIISGFFALTEVADERKRIEQEFKEACAKVNGLAVWNKKWECLK